jgi:hypothetical protein
MRIILALTVAVFLSGYVGFLMVLAYHTLDPPAFTALLGLLYLGWYGCMHERPRLRPA